MVCWSRSLLFVFLDVLRVCFIPLIQSVNSPGYRYLLLQETYMVRPAIHHDLRTGDNSQGMPVNQVVDKSRSIRNPYSHNLTFYLLVQIIRKVVSSCRRESYPLLDVKLIHATYLIHLFSKLN